MADKVKRFSKRGRINEGKPPYYDSPEELQAAVDKYFRERDEASKQEMHRPHYTICGLALALGFVSRQSLLDYAEKPEYLDIIKKAKLKVENNYEESLRSPAPTGSIFALKNMKWDDKQQLEHSGEAMSITVNVQAADEPPIDEKQTDKPEEDNQASGEGA